MDSDLKEERGKFSGRMGFVMAAAGSAVGLGNLWRFPYLAASYGGGVFILVYIILTVTFGFTLLITEIAIGRKTGFSAIKAYRKIDRSFGIVGWLSMIVPIIILPYYCVIGGWVIKYVLVFAFGQGNLAAEADYFNNYIGGVWNPLWFFLLFLLLTAYVVGKGVQQGVEKVSKLLMPVLLLIVLAVPIYIMTLPGAIEGIKYYLLPDLSEFSIKTVCAAMGQLFFSLSIAMGIMISFGSYVKDSVNLNQSVYQIEIFDTVVAFLAGLMIIPAVFVFYGEEGLSSSGPGLMFITLPAVFKSMPMGQVVGGVFFILVLAAALTSSVSMMEAIVSIIMDTSGLKRRGAVLIIVILSIVIGVPVSLGNGVWSGIRILGMDLLNFIDYIANSILMPVVALLTCILIGWRVGPRVVEQEVTRNGEKFARKRMYRIMIRYIAPVLLTGILIFYTMVQFEIISY